MDDFYYIDRPTVPALQQVAINLSALREHSVLVLTDQMGSWWAHAAEVKNSDSEVVGVIAYFNALTYEDLISPNEKDIEAAEQDNAAHESTETSPSVDFNQVDYHYDGKDFAADKEVAELLEQVEANQIGDYEGDEGDLIDSLADALVRLQIRNNNQRDMLMKRSSDDEDAI